MKTFLLLLASAALVAPVTAAEVGVRHSWGNTTSQVTNGSSRTVSQSQGSFIERTRGISGGTSGSRSGASAFDRLATGSNSSRTVNPLDLVAQQHQVSVRPVLLVGNRLIC